MRRFACLIVLFGLLPAVAGCSGPPPHIHEPDEFNRESKTFGKQPEDLDSVAICYARRSTTPQAVREMAQAACGKYGKAAVFRDQDYLQCPLITPARANFACVEPPPRSR